MDLLTDACPKQARERRPGLLRRRTLPLLLLLARPARAQTADPLHPSPDEPFTGPHAAAGAFVWLHGGYDRAALAPPAAPGWVGRMARRRYDIWRFDRPGHDRLAEGGARLARGLRALRAAGYRRIVVGGHSRGGWIALTVLARPGLADAVAALSPAAHGTDPARRAQAMADWTALMRAVVPGGPPGGVRVALVLLADDPLDPDTRGRLRIARAALARAGDPLLAIDRPPEPRGHLGAYDPAFDALFGELLAAWLAGD